MLTHYEISTNHVIDLISFLISASVGFDFQLNTEESFGILTKELQCSSNIEVVTLDYL